MRVGEPTELREGGILIALFPSIAASMAKTHSTLSFSPSFSLSSVFHLHLLTVTRISKASSVLPWTVPLPSKRVGLAVK